ncbi:MAG: hypothetical protein HYV09_32365 [Deltaproteobacteria bacterium]|nr:hypothetical protein [Deltaproteobacteria bacterium]
MSTMSLIEALRRIVGHVATIGHPSSEDRWLFVEQLQRLGVEYLDAKHLVDAAIAEGLEHPQLHDRESAAP